MPPFTKRLLTASVIAAVSAATPVYAQTTSVQRQLEEIRRQMNEMRAGYERKVDALEQRIKTLERENATQKTAATEKSAAAPNTATAATRQSTAAPETAGAKETAAAKPKPAKARAPGVIYSDGGNEFQIGLATTIAGGGSSVGNEALQLLERGDHDPNKNGFTLQSAELFLGGTVDPYFDAQANISLKIDAEGETVVELEEAFARTRSLPYGLQIKAGQYYTAFGRANPMHLHRWDFVDAPVVLTRLLGPDGLRSQGAQVSWLSPLPWFSEVTFGAQNAKGETAVSFLGEEGEDIGGFEQMDRQARNLGDLLYSARWLNGFDIDETVSMNVGVSTAIGPNATGSSANTYIFGADIFTKWQPDVTERGFPFVAFQAEALYRDFNAGDNTDPNRQTLKDWGFYAQSLWGFSPGWVAGLRLGHANAHEGLTSKGDDPLRDSRWRLSPNITWYPSEFSKIRLQYNRDWAEHLDGEEQDGTADTIWLQFEFSLGGHFAHTF